MEERNSERAQYHLFNVLRLGRWMEITAAISLLNMLKSEQIS